MAPPTKRQRKRGETKYETKDWRWLLWDSDLARDKIHPELSAGWTAVLKEACCVKAGVHKDKVNRVRKEGDQGGPLRLWPKQGYDFCHSRSGPFLRSRFTLSLSTSFLTQHASLSTAVHAAPSSG